MDIPKTYPVPPAPMAPSPALSRAEWLSRCAARLVAASGMAQDVAWGIAESQLENLNDDLTESPEEAADDEMSYWTAD